MGAVIEVYSCICPAATSTHAFQGRMIGQHKRPLEDFASPQSKYLKQAAECSCEPNAWGATQCHGSTNGCERQVLASVSGDGAAASSSCRPALRGPFVKDVTSPLLKENGPESSILAAGPAESFTFVRPCVWPEHIRHEGVSPGGGASEAHSDCKIEHGVLDDCVSEPGTHEEIGVNKQSLMGLERNTSCGYDGGELHMFNLDEETSRQTRTSIEGAERPTARLFNLDERSDRKDAAIRKFNRGFANEKQVKQSFGSMITHRREERKRDLWLSVEATHPEKIAFLEIVQRTLEARPAKGARPLPVLMGDKVVDLLGLNSQVTNMGGYGKVTQAGLWRSISEGLGLGLDCGPGLKLVYVKYLKALEIRRSLTTQGDNHFVSSDRPDASSSHTSDVVFTSGRPDINMTEVSEHIAETESLGRHADVGIENGGCSPELSDELHRCVTGEVLIKKGLRKRERERECGDTSLSDEDISGNQPGIREPLLECRQSMMGGDWVTTHASVEHLSEVPSSKGERDEGGDRPQTLGSDSDTVDDDDDDWDEGESEERNYKEREALVGMLEWMKIVALDSGLSSEAEASGQEDWKNPSQVLAAKVRSVLWKEMRTGDAYLQAKQTFVPSVFYDESARPDPQTLERLRATQQRLAYYGSQSLAGSNNRATPSSQQERNDRSYSGPSGTQSTQRTTRQPAGYNDTGHARYPYSDRLPRKRIPIGPDFQAHVDPWTSLETSYLSAENGRVGPARDETQSSDDEVGDFNKWFGVPVWPLPGGCSIANENRIGRGRPPTCDCIDPESLDCVRFHVEVAREKLKRELGQAFYQMGFDQMGESVANQWSKEEEQTFRSLARGNPASLDKNFWDQLPVAFPMRTKKELVSYYFNVFVLRRRALQNRLVGEKVDSDDDETELPDDSDDSGYASVDEDEEDDDDGGDDSESDDLLDSQTTSRPPDDTELQGLEAVPVYKYSSTGGLVLEAPFCSGVRDNAHAPSSAVDAEERGALHQLESNEPSSHMVLGWDDKHLVASSMGQAEALQVARHWEDPQWDDRDPQHVSAVLSEPVTTPSIGKEDAMQQRTGGLGELWGRHMEIAPRKEKDKLLSTNGMILELFGDDVGNGSNN